MNKSTKKHSNNLMKYLLAGIGVLAIVAVGVVLFNRNPAIEDSAKEIEGAVEKSSDELLSSSSDGSPVENPGSGSLGQPGYQVVEGGSMSGDSDQTPVLEEIPTVIVAEVDLSTRPQQELDNEPNQSEEFLAELEGEGAAYVADFEGNDSDSDILTEAGVTHSKEVQDGGNSSDKDQSDTHAESESAKTEPEEQSSQGTRSEKEPETSGSGESGEQETGKSAEPSTEASGESVTESSAEEEVRESVESSTESVTVTVAESASESTTVPPVREMKKLVLGEESVTVPLESPESIGDLNKLTGTERYELSLQFDSVSAYNEYIALLKKADDMQRVEAGKNPGI